MEQALFLMIGLIVGGLAGFLWAGARLSRQIQQEREQRVTSETRLEEHQKQLAAQQALVEQARAQLSDTFKALSSDALQANTQAFVERAKQTLEPVQEALRRYEEQVREIERTRQHAYGSLEQRLTRMAEAEQQLQRETANLVTALRRPDVRGRWGELTLHRAVELAGLAEHCDFSEQVSVSGDAGRLRPDMIIHLPGGRDIVVDSKVPLDAYLSAAEAADEEGRKSCLNRHCQQVRQHMNSLAGKSYWDQFPSAPEFVVMFIPGESFLSAAASEDPNLIEDSMERRVFPATPITLVALLRTVAHGWRQEQIARSAQEVSELGRTLYDRLRVFADHMSDVGKRLKGATESYNQAVGSLESRVLPSARKFRDLGAGTSADITELAPTETQPRELAAPEGEQDS